MSVEPPYAPFDPEERLREAIDTFEQARTDCLRPDPQEWLLRYPEIADRLAKYFRFRRLSSPKRPASGFASWSAPWPETPATDRRVDLTDDEFQAGMGLDAAFGLCLLVMLTALGFGVALGIGIGIFGLKLDRDYYGPAALVLTSVFFGLMGRAWLGSKARRKMALRGIAGLHLLLVLLLVLPLFLVASKIAIWATLGLDQALGHVRGAAYLDLFDRGFDALARQSWPLVFLVGCICPAVGEEVSFEDSWGAVWWPVMGPRAESCTPHFCLVWCTLIRCRS